MGFTKFKFSTIIEENVKSTDFSLGNKILTLLKKSIIDSWGFLFFTVLRYPLLSIVIEMSKKQKFQLKSDLYGISRTLFLLNVVCYF